MPWLLGFCSIASISVVVPAAGSVAANLTASCAAGNECRRSLGVLSAGVDHLLLQFGGSRLSYAMGEEGLQDVGSSGCSGMPDVKRKCSSDGCRVLADGMMGLSCNDYCQRSGRSCTSAWEEVNNDCNVKQPLRCDETYGTTSDLLCQCSELSGSEPGSVPASQLIWSDDFDGAQIDDSKWHMVVGGGGFGNSELQHYTDRHTNAHVQDGVLRITAKCEQYGRDWFTSAKLTTKRRASWGPGHRFEVRARMPTAKGTWPAIWMLPTEKAYGRWPDSGEIDIMETVGCGKDKIFGTVHTGAYNHMKNTQKYGSRYIPVAAWHTYGMQWTEQSIQWFVDGELYGTFDPTQRDSDRWPFNKDFYLILNLAVGGSWGGWCLNGAGPSCSPGSEFNQGQVMEVDFVRVYRV